MEGEEEDAECAMRRAHVEWMERDEREGEKGTGRNTE
jgi:hypothetical protein